MIDHEKIRMAAHGISIKRLLMRGIRPPLVLALSVILTLLAVAATYPAFSNTYDEPAHLATGLELLDLGTYYYERHHPPLARAAIALGPYLAGSRSAREYTAPASDPTSDFWIRMMKGSDEGRRILYEGGDHEHTLTLARLGILPFLLLSLLVTYAWARNLLGEWPAVLAVFLLATVPPFLGNAGIATLDVPAAALGVASMLAFCHWLDRPRIGTALGLGVTTGAAIMTKFSAIPFLGVAFLAIFLWRAWIAARNRAPVVAPAHVRTGAGAVATMLLVFWMCYGFGFTTLADPKNRPYESIESLMGPGSAASKLVSDAVEIPWVPTFIPQMAEGIEDVAYHNRIGHRSYLLGEVRSHGWWYYYLVALGVKTPLLFLLAGLCGVGLMLGASVLRRDWRVAAPAIGFLAILAFASIYSNINLGVRHILILYPLLAIAAAYVATRLVQVVRRKALAGAAVMLLVVSQAATSILAYPDLMTYFNAIAGANPGRILMPIDLDWGQDLKRLETALQQRKVDRVAVAYFGSADLTRHNLPGYSALVPHTPQTGWIAVSLWRLTRDLDFAWLRSFEPEARIGTSINLYHLTDQAAIARLAPSIIELAPGVYMRDKKNLHGSNQAFIEFGSYVVVFDPSTIIQARQLLEEIRTRMSKPVRYVIVSHFHPDHSAGAAVFAAAGAEIVAAAAARNDFEVWLRKDFANKTLSRPAEYRGVAYSPPSRYIESTWVLDDGVQRLEVIPVGHGHTSGDLVAWMPKYRILFAGDLSTDGFLNLANANISGWIAAIERLRALNPDQVVLGHGPLAKAQALEASQRYLVQLQSKVRSMMAGGMTFEEIARWYGNTPARTAMVDVELAYAEAGGIQDRSSPLITGKCIGWTAALVAAILLFIGFRSWMRRRAK